MFSKEFAIAIKNEIFNSNSVKDFHDVVLEVCGISCSVDVLQLLFMELPEELQIIALQWGLEDTSNTDNIRRELQSSKNGYIFLIKKLKKKCQQ